MDEVVGEVSYGKPVARSSAADVVAAEGNDEVRSYKNNRKDDKVQYVANMFSCQLHIINKRLSGFNTLYSKDGLNPFFIQLSSPSRITKTAHPTKHSIRKREHLFFGGFYHERISLGAGRRLCLESGC